MPASAQIYNRLILMGPPEDRMSTNGPPPFIVPRNDRRDLVPREATLSSERTVPPLDLARISMPIFFGK